MCVTRFIYMCDTTHSRAGHDSFICVTWLIHMSGMTIYRCDMGHWCIRRDSLTYAQSNINPLINGFFFFFFSNRKNSSFQIYSQIFSTGSRVPVGKYEVSHVTHINESCDTYEWVMWHMRMSHVAQMMSHSRHTDTLYQNIKCLMQDTNV